MTSFRGSIPDFQLANPLYPGALVTFFTVDQDGHSTGVLASLYDDTIGVETVNNPQTLDGEGKFYRPVYIDAPCVASVTGLNVPSHTTGVINTRGVWRGEWTTATVYFSTDFVLDAGGTIVYAAVDDYLSGATLADDVAAGHLVLVLTALTATAAALFAYGGAPITAAGNVTVNTIQPVYILNKTVGAPTSILLPTAASRNLIPVTVKDYKGDANTNNITFVPNGTETIDGFSPAAAITNGSALIDINYGKKTLFPLLSGGWYL